MRAKRDDDGNSSKKADYRQEHAGAGSGPRVLTAMRVEEQAVRRVLGQGVAWVESVRRVHPVVTPGYVDLDTPRLRHVPPDAAPVGVSQLRHTTGGGPPIFG